jgi:hypothetical protein
VTPRQLFGWAYLNLTNMNVILVIEEQYKEEEKLLFGRFSQPVQSVEPRNYIPFCQSGMVLLPKMYSASSDSTECSTTSDLNDSMQLKDITGIVTCVCDS